MKLVLRTAVLLAAALVVTGALLAFGRTTMAERLLANRPGHAHVERDGPPGGFEGRPEGRPEGFGGQGRGDRHGASLFGLGELFKNLVLIGIVVAVVTLGARLIGLARTRARRDPPAPPAATGETSRL